VPPLENIFRELTSSGHELTKKTKRTIKGLF